MLEEKLPPTIRLTISEINNEDIAKNNDREEKDIYDFLVCTIYSERISLLPLDEYVELFAKFWKLSSNIYSESLFEKILCIWCDSEKLRNCSEVYLEHITAFLLGLWPFVTNIDGFELKISEGIGYHLDHVNGNIRVHGLVVGEVFASSYGRRIGFDIPRLDSYKKLVGIHDMANKLKYGDSFTSIFSELSLKASKEEPSPLDELYEPLKNLPQPPVFLGETAACLISSTSSKCQIELALMELPFQIMHSNFGLLKHCARELLRGLLYLDDDGKFTDRKTCLKLLIYKLPMEISDLVIDEIYSFNTALSQKLLILSSFSEMAQESFRSIAGLSKSESESEYYLIDCTNLQRIFSKLLLHSQRSYFFSKYSSKIAIHLIEKILFCATGLLLASDAEADGKIDPSKDYVLLLQFIKQIIENDNYMNQTIEKDILKCLFSISEKICYLIPYSEEISKDVHFFIGWIENLPSSSIDSEIVKLKNLTLTMFESSRPKIIG